MRRLILLMTAMGAAVLVASGVAYALNVQCDTATDQDPDPGQCRGTNQTDFIAGTALSDQIFALGGFDEVEARAGEDELNGGPSNDTLAGEEDNDTYNGGGGNDWLTEWQPEGGFDFALSGNDVMNGGGGHDFIEGNQGNDILRGQEGNDSVPGAVFISMWGDLGDDELRGGPGEDVMAGEEGTDKHFGGTDNDFIDAAQGDSDEDPADLVDCGSGVDTAIVRPNDIVRGNCENVPGRTTITTAPDSGTTAEEQQQQAEEAFLQENSLQP